MRKVEGLRFRGLFALVSVALALLGGGTSCRRPDAVSRRAQPGGSAPAARYVCPMHPQQTSDKPGDCAVCGMKLVLESGSTAGTQPSAGPAGLAPVHVSDDTRKQMGLTFATVQRRAARRELRTPARILADQSRVFRMNAPVDGWVEKLWVNGVGERIRKGDPVLQLYSADGLYLFRQNLIIAARESTQDVIRERLRRWGLEDSQIDQLIQPNSKVQQVLTLVSPTDGFVAERTVYAGQKLSTGEPLLVIADLSHVWAEIDLFESDIPWVKPGMTATITFPYWVGKEFKGKVTVLNPFLDPQTRTLRARLEVPNGSLELRPEMYGTAYISVSMGERLVVPEQAVMRTGERDYAFRAAEGDRIDPVEVKLGARTEGAWEVLSGLAEGDRVVASANFLVDSESALKAAMQAVSGK